MLIKIVYFTHVRIFSLLLYQKINNTRIKNFIFTFHDSENKKYKSMSNGVIFDQRLDEFALPTTRGFIIYDFQTANILYEAIFPGGGANCLSILSDSNVVAASGDGSREGFSEKTVILWDRVNNKVIGLFEVDNPVTALVFRLEVIIVMHGNKVSFHNSFDFSEKLKTTIPDSFGFAVVPTNSIYLTALPSAGGKSIDIVDYHDPSYVLGSIPIDVSKVAHVAFDRKGSIMAIVVDEGRIIQLWDVNELRLLITYKRGMRTCDVTGIAFDDLSSYFIMTTLRGTMHVFAVPTPKEREQLDPKQTVRSKFSYDMPKGINFHCQFDLAGYTITGVSDIGDYKRIRLDLEKGNVVPLEERKLEF